MADASEFRRNNFGLLRLLAATQVLIVHSRHRFGLDPGLAEHFLSIFPGVPIFFFISGFLISRSYERNSNLKQYSLNRILRIYPGLWACFLVNLGSILVLGYAIKAPLTDFVVWVAGQLTIVQFYNPGWLRSYGTGVFNASLWTISVEVQFYVLTALLYGLLKLRDGKRANLCLIVLILIFLPINRVYYFYQDEMWHIFYFKLFGQTFAPYFYMFLLGVFFQKNFDFFLRISKNRCPLFFAIYSLIAILGYEKGLSRGNCIDPISFILLAGVVFAFAYSFHDLSKRMLAGNDISYGMYIYHIPVVNALIFMGYKECYILVMVVLVLTALLALLSWVLVEKRVLSLKRNPLNPVLSHS